MNPCPFCQTPLALTFPSQYHTLQYHCQQFSHFKINYFNITDDVIITTIKLNFDVDNINYIIDVFENVTQIRIAQNNIITYDQCFFHHINDWFQLTSKDEILNHIKIILTFA